MTPAAVVDRDLPRYGRSPSSKTDDSTDSAEKWEDPDIGEYHDAVIIDRVCETGARIQAYATADGESGLQPDPQAMGRPLVPAVAWASGDMTVGVAVGEGGFGSRVVLYVQGVRRGPAELGRDESPVGVPPR